MACKGLAELPEAQLQGLQLCGRPALQVDVRAIGPELRQLRQLALEGAVEAGEPGEHLGRPLGAVHREAAPAGLQILLGARARPCLWGAVSMA